MSEPANTAVRLTVAIAVHQASEGLAASAESIREVADETLIVVLDKTHIASPRDAQLLQCENPLDPALTRNRALDAASGDWILWLEAGETLDHHAVAGIRAWKQSPEASATDAAYQFWVYTPAELPDQCGERVSRTRLFPLRAGVQFTGNVDESVDASLAQLGRRTLVAQWSLHEGPHVHATEFRARIAQRNALLAHHEIQSRGMNARALIASAAALSLTGDRAKGTQHYYQALRLADRGSVEMLVAYYGLLSTFGDSEAERRQQLDVCLEALETYPFDAQLLSAMGTYLQQQQHVELACRSFQAAVDIGQVEPRAPHLAEIHAVAAVSWSLLLQVKGDLEGALRVLESACERFQGSRRLQRARMELLVQAGQDVAVLQHAAELTTGDVPLEPLRIGLRGACLAAQGNWIPAFTYLRTSFDAGCREPICLRWFTVGLIGLGQTEAARSVLQAWREAVPHDQEAARYSEELGAAPTPASRSLDKKRSIRVDRPQPPLAHPDVTQGASAPTQAN